jgi:arylsulfatase A-like enzyme
MVASLDEQIGRVLSFLDGQDLHEESIVILFSDNGPNADRFNVGLRGRKGAFHDRRIRAPYFIHWLRVLRPQVRRERLTPTPGKLRMELKEVEFR